MSPLVSYLAAWRGLENLLVALLILRKTVYMPYMQHVYHLGQLDPARLSTDILIECVACAIPTSFLLRMHDTLRHS